MFLPIEFFLSALQITVPFIMQRNAILVRFKAGGKGTTEDETVGWHHQLNGHGFG